LYSGKRTLSPPSGSHDIVTGMLIVRLVLREKLSRHLSRKP
jgi:hypothetical protein